MAHKYRCELEDREHDERKQRKLAERAYEQATGRKIAVNEARSSSSDDEEDVQVLPRLPKSNQGPLITSAPSSAMNIDNNELIREREKVQKLEERLKMLEGLMKQVQQQPQPQSRPQGSGDADIDAFVAEIAPQSPTAQLSDQFAQSTISDREKSNN